MYIALWVISVFISVAIGMVLMSLLRSAAVADHWLLVDKHDQLEANYETLQHEYMRLYNAEVLASQLDSLDQDNAVVLLEDLGKLQDVRGSFGKNPFDDNGGQA